MLKRKGSRLALVICVAMVMTLFCAVPAMAKTKGKLVKECKYTWQKYDFDKDKWVSHDGYDLYKFKYNKEGDLVKTYTKKVEDGKSSIQDKSTFKYKYTKKGVIKSRTQSSYGDKIVMKYKKGVPVKEVMDGYFTDKFKFKSRYVCWHSSRSYYDEEDKWKTKTRSMKVTAKKGYPVKITYKMNDGTCTALFNTKGKAKGLIKSITEDTSDSNNKFTFNYKIKKGKVTNVEMITVNEDKEVGEIQKYRDKFKFKYTKKKAGAKRYGSMINDIVTSGIYVDGNSYNFVQTYW